MNFDEKEMYVTEDKIPRKKYKCNRDLFRMYILLMIEYPSPLPLPLIQFVSSNSYEYLRTSLVCFETSKLNL